MAEKALIRLRNLLKLEALGGLRGKYFAGGVGAFFERWSEDAQGEAVAAGLIDRIGELLEEYDSVDPTERPPILDALFEVAEEEESGSETELSSIDQVGSSQQRLSAGADPVPSQPANAPTIPEVRDRSTLDARITTVKGVGPKTAEHYGRLGIETVEDLVWHLPFRHEDYSRVLPISEVEPGESLSLVANLWKVSERKTYKSRILQATFNDGTGSILATWWNQPWKKKTLTEGKSYRLSGKVDLYRGRKTLNNPTVEEIRLGKANNRSSIFSIYPTTEGLKSSDIEKHLGSVLDRALKEISDPVPASICDQFDLIALDKALTSLHRPQQVEDIEPAARRLAFNEFFYLQLGVQLRREQLRSRRARPLTSDEVTIGAFRAGLPFQMTDAQERVVDEVRRDLARELPMSRLVQGDVGSGKTVIAAAAMSIATANGAQSVMLAPTQILAEQHYRSLSKLLEPMRRVDGTPLRTALLTGRVGGAEREAIITGLADGSIDVAVGTTALIQESVTYREIGLVVVDEQHRFGVEQRSALRSEGDLGGVPHMLVMSATPIPRSLALTIYGDLNVSVIDELPPGRTPITTKRFMPAEVERLFAFLRRQVEAGRQGYIIYPLVEESEKLDVGAAVDAYDHLRKEVFPDLRLGLLHGRLSGSEKDEVMRGFSDGLIDILVSTSVVEVGVDVPNATVMLIQDAERFGLAQLHQFRGRVGRGEHASYCALISRADEGQSLERLEALVESNDGFVLAEKDLELRGPGDFMGKRQSGLPDLRMAVLGDMVTLSAAREAARMLLAEDGNLSQHPQLQYEVARFWKGEGDVN